MSKLYGLFSRVSDDDCASFVLASKSIEKIHRSITLIDRTWEICSDPNDKTLRSKSRDGIFPEYQIREIPHIC